MNYAHWTGGTEAGLGKPLTAAQTLILKRAVAKIVFLGAQVGVSTDQMITLLESGLTVGELLDYIGARGRNMA